MTDKEKQNSDIPKTHPRYQSLKYRHKIIEGLRSLVVTEAGVIAHGRGECFDYILGEKTSGPAKMAIKTAVAKLIYFIRKKEELKLLRRFLNNQELLISEELMLRKV
ncbi:MAG: hypothetical protein ACTSQD_00715 [Promethearchaeota archaeon]